MNPDSLFAVFDAIMFAAGIYCAYSWHYMKTKRQIHDNRMTIPPDISIEACRNPAAYMAYMLPRMLVFSILCIVFGGLNLLTHVTQIPQQVQFVCIVALFVNIVWFAVVLRKSIQNYWPNTKKPEKPLS